MNMDRMISVKEMILVALQHPEAQDGLYFRNFRNLHEEDERPAVEADEIEILDALKELMNEGRVLMDESGPEMIFLLASRQAA